MEIMDDLFGTVGASAKVEKLEKGSTASAQMPVENRIEAKVFAEPQKDPTQILSLRKTPLKYTVQQAEVLINIALFLETELVGSTYLPVTPEPAKQLLLKISSTTPTT